MLDRAIITSASNKFFPSLLNLLGSLKHNYPACPHIFVYDLGLLAPFRKELEAVPGVTCISMPAFVPFWRSCYTWKPYIFANPVARLNFYLDAGCQVLRPLDSVFEEIDKDGYFLIYQGGVFTDIVPKEYVEKFQLPSDLNSLQCLHAGIFGFKAGSVADRAITFTYEAAQAGLAIGFSLKEQWRNKGVNKNTIVRDCPVFRHDMTLLNIGFRKEFKNNLIVHSIEQYAGGKDAHPHQYIWQLRLSYRMLDFLSPYVLHKAPPFVSLCNRVIVYGMLLFKYVNLEIKRLWGIVP